MNIKQSVIFFLLLTGVSFSALFFSTQAQAQDLYRVVRIEDARMGCAYPPGSISNRSYPSQALLCYGNRATYDVKALPDRPGLFGIFTAGSSVGYWHTPVVLQPFSCPDGTEFNPDNGKCEDPPFACLDLKDKDAPFPSVPLPDDGKPMTATRSYCDTGTMCESVYFYYASEGDLYRSTAYTGLDCVGSESDYADSPWYRDPEPDPDPDPEPEPEPEPEPDPTHTPNDNTAPIEDPSVLPDSSTSTPSVDPDPVDPKPDVSTPDPTPDSNGDIVQSVVNMNTDVNKLLTDLNEDMNKDNADIQAELKALNEQALDNTKAIVDLHVATKQAAENEKSLLLGINADVTTAVNKVANAVNTGMGKLEGDLDGISDKIDKMLSGDGRSFNQPQSGGDWDGDGGSGTALGGATEELEGQREGLETKLKDLIAKSPFNLGQMDFNPGQYTPIQFELEGRGIEVSFNFFTKLGGNIDLIRTVIIFIALLSAAFIVLTAGRTR